MKYLMACRHTQPDVIYGKRPFCIFRRFQELVVDDATLIALGDPNQSVLRCEGNGTAPWTSMPLGNRNYQQ